MLFSGSTSVQEQKMFELQVFVNAISVISKIIANNGPNCRISTSILISLLFPQGGELTLKYPSRKIEACAFLDRNRLIQKAPNNNNDNNNDDDSNGEGRSTTTDYVISITKPYANTYLTILNSLPLSDGNTIIKLESFLDSLEKVENIEGVVKWFEQPLEILIRERGPDGKTWIRASPMFLSCYAANGIDIFNQTPSGAIKSKVLTTAVASTNDNTSKVTVAPTAVAATANVITNNTIAPSIKPSTPPPAAATTTATSNNVPARMLSEFEEYKEATCHRLRFWNLARRFMPRHEGGSILKSRLFEQIQAVAPTWNRTNPARQKFFDELSTLSAIPSCGFEGGANVHSVLTANTAGTLVLVQLRGIHVAPKKAPPVNVAAAAVAAATTPKTTAPTPTPLTYADMTLHLRELLAALPLGEEVAKQLLQSQFGWAAEKGKFHGIFEAHISKGTAPAVVRFQCGNLPMIALTETRTKMLKEEEKKRLLAVKHAAAKTTAATTLAEPPQPKQLLTVPVPIQLPQPTTVPELPITRKSSASWEPDLLFYFFFDLIRNKLQCAPSGDWKVKSVVSETAYSRAGHLFADRDRRTHCFAVLTERQVMEFSNNVICAVSKPSHDTLLRLNDPLPPCERVLADALPKGSAEKMESDLRQIFAHCPLRKTTAMEVLHRQGWSEAATASAFKRYYDQMPLSTASFHLLALSFSKEQFAAAGITPTVESDPFVALVDAKHQFYFEHAVDSGLKKQLIENLKNKKFDPQQNEEKPSRPSTPPPISIQIPKPRHESLPTVQFVPTPMSFFVSNHPQDQPTEKQLHRPSPPPPPASNQEDLEENTSLPPPAPPQNDDRADELLETSSRSEREEGRIIIPAIVPKEHEEERHEVSSQPENEEETVFSRSRITVLDRPQLSKIAMMIRLERNRQDREIIRCTNTEKQLKAAVSAQTEMKNKIEALKKKLEMKQKENAKLQQQQKTSEEYIRQLEIQRKNQMEQKNNADRTDDDLFSCQTAFFQDIPYQIDVQVLKREMEILTKSNKSNENDDAASSSSSSSNEIKIPHQPSQKQFSLLCQVQRLMKIGGTFFAADYPSLVNSCMPRFKLSGAIIKSCRHSSAGNELRIFDKNYCCVASSQEKPERSPSSIIEAVVPPNSTEEKNYFLHVALLLQKLYLVKKTSKRHDNGPFLIHCFKIQDEFAGDDETENDETPSFSPNLEYALLVANKLMDNKNMLAASNNNNDNANSERPIKISWYVASFEKPALYFDSESDDEKNQSSKRDSILRNNLNHLHHSNDAMFVGLRLSNNSPRAAFMNPAVANSRSDLTYLEFSVKDKSKQLFKICDLEFTLPQSTGNFQKIF